VAPRPSGGRERVLHVLTTAYDTGGHTRAALRWMELDDGRDHALHLTRHPIAIPKVVTVPVDRPPEDATPLQRAAHLRALAAQHDLVVLHHHPNDPVPLAAFPLGAARPPLLAFNHADHTFWLGRALPDVLVSYRATGRDLAIARRGMAPDRHAVLPLPVTAPERADRAAARRALGLQPDEIAVLTVGTPYKFDAPDGGHLLDVVEPVLADHPRARLIAAGPPPEGRWAAAGPQVQALGFAHIAPLYAAADVYLESYPCGGSTALAEAAFHALPVLSYAPDPVEAELLATDADPAFQRFERAGDFRAGLAALIDDVGTRRRWGTRALEEAVRRVDPAAWRERLEAAIALARERGPVDAGELGAVPALDDAFDARLLALHEQGGRVVAPEAVRTLESAIAAAASGPAVRDAYATLSGPSLTPLLRHRFRVALAAPAVTPDGLAAALEALRVLQRARVVESAALTVPPEDVDAAAGILEPLMRDDDDLELVPHPDPAALVLDGTLHVRTPGDRWGTAPSAAGVAEATF
jgi:hypothetical protein